MKLVSFNINGLRARMHQLQAIINLLKPDIIGLQETKVQDNCFPIEQITQYGYYSYFYGEKQFYGVALLSRKKLFNIRYGFINDTTKQKRIMMADTISKLGNITIINGYFPQGENINHPTKFLNKKKFYQSLQKYIESNYHKNSLLLIMGDMNISPTNLDIGIDKKHYERWIKTGKCSFLPEERTWINNLKKWGLIDIYRYIHPKNTQRCYSWFDYRTQHYNFKINKGLRIDLLLTTYPLAIQCKHSDINYEIRAMKKPSDHAPIIAEFNL